MKRFIICLFTTFFLSNLVYANDLKELKLSINNDKTKAIKIFESKEDIDFKNFIFEDFENDNFKYTKENITVDRITKEDKKNQTESLSIILTSDEKENLNTQKILALFQDTLPYEKEGYKGIL